MQIERSNSTPMQTAIINQKTVIEEINQIYNAEYQIVNMSRNEQSLELEIRAVYMYSSFENQFLNRKEETFNLWNCWVRCATGRNYMWRKIAGCRYSGVVRT